MGVVGTPSDLLNRNDLSKLDNMTTPIANGKSMWSRFIEWGNDHLQFDKYVAEWLLLWDTFKVNFKEITYVNRPRYKQPKEWVHLWIDFWNSLFQILKAAVMPYTFSHIVGVALPLFFIGYLIGLFV